MLPGPGSEAIGAQGAAWLRRSADRIDGRVMVKVDQANTSYSIWWIIFNVDIEVVAGEGTNNGHSGIFPGNEVLEGVLNPENGLDAEVHIDINQHSVFDTDRVTELTTPEGETHRFSIFEAVH